MNNLIKKIEIHNFRSLHHTIIEPGEITGFMGENDAGKSNILKALNLFFNNQTDFLQEIDFPNDYCKFGLAGSKIANKQKQQIKIKIYFNPPKSYKSLQNQNIYLEKTYSRDNSVSLTYSLEGKGQANISRLVGTIKYVYIPALKGPQVLRYLIGLLGGLDILDLQKINELNQHIQDKTSSLSRLVSDSKIPISVKFGLPSTLETFRQNLNANTVVDGFENLVQNVRKTPKSNTSLKLDEGEFLIPLSNRGDGIKSKYIPPLLQWIESKQDGKRYIRGIDEPENSLEFRAADEVASLYYNEYALNNQIFFTSHSLAFLNPENVKIPPKLYICEKNIAGYTEHIDPNTLFSEGERIDVFEKIGILELQKEVISMFREKIIKLKNDQDLLKNEVQEFSNLFPEKIFICEDKNLINFWTNLFFIYRIEGVTIYSSGGCTTKHLEIIFENKIKEKQGYSPRILRQIDRGGLKDEDIQKLIQNLEKYLCNARSFYKILPLPVYEVESFSLLDEEFNKYRNDADKRERILNDTKSELQDKLKLLKKQELTNIDPSNITTLNKYIENLKDNPIQNFAGKAYVTLKENFKRQKIILESKEGDIPLLDAYMKQLKEFYES